MTIRKIGGIYWLSLGRIRLAFCIVRTKPTKLPHVDNHKLVDLRAF